MFLICSDESFCLPLHNTDCRVRGILEKQLVKLGKSLIWHSFQLLFDSDIGSNCERSMVYFLQRETVTEKKDFAAIIHRQFNQQVTCHSVLMVWCAVLS